MPKRIQPLSDLQVKNAKPKEKVFKLVDGLGLHLLVTLSGGKLWRFQYRCEGEHTYLLWWLDPLSKLFYDRKRRINRH